VKRLYLFTKTTPLKLGELGRELNVPREQDKDLEPEGKEPYTRTDDGDPLEHAGRGNKRLLVHIKTEHFYANMAPAIAFSVENDIVYTTVNGVRGTLNPHDCMTLIAHAKNLSSGQRYIETGSYLGCSALLVALHSNVTVWAHDLWVTDWSELKGCPPPMVEDYFYKFYSAVKANNLVNRIVPIRGNSVYTVGIHDDKSVDLCFIDGDHSYEGCYGDLEAVFPKMAPSGIVLVHDCVPGSEPLKAVEEFTRTKGLDFTIIEGTWGMARIEITPSQGPP